VLIPTCENMWGKHSSPSGQLASESSHTSKSLMSLPLILYLQYIILTL
jgi:hypothetical protein